MKIINKNFQINLFNPYDYKAFFSLLQANKSRLQDFFAGTLLNTKTLEDTKIYCEQMVQRIDQKTYLPYIISSINTNEFIGLVDVKNINWQTLQAELGYFINADYEKKGIITQATGQVINHIILEHKFKKLLCRIGSQNIASQMVALKNGFKLEETRKKDYQISDGSFVDLDYYTRYFKKGLL
jgi:RimJ/RimL family protein N-acetyltransferase